MVIGGRMKRRKQELWEIVKRAGEGCVGVFPSGVMCFNRKAHKDGAGIVPWSTREQGPRRSGTLKSE
jgi:hypothetical protein